MRIILCGFGVVAQSFSDLLESRTHDLYSKFGLKPRIVGVFDSKGCAYNEAGLDLKFLKNRLGVDVTYFTSQNGPQIFALQVPSSTGYAAQNVNAIISKKQGYEIAVSGSPIKSARGLNWEVAVNYATYKETLQDVYGDFFAHGLWLFIIYSSNQ
jgi:hypothetical protein